MKPRAPVITEAMREAARRQPGSWFYAIDPFFDPNGRVPPFGVVGAWKINERGEFTEEFKQNPKYKPSPVALEYPEPTDPLDLTIQLASTGYGSSAEVLRVFLERTILLGQPPAIGESVFSVFSHPLHAPETLRESTPVAAHEWVLSLDKGSIAINPLSQIGLRLPVADAKLAANSDPSTP